MADADQHVDQRMIVEGGWTREGGAKGDERAARPSRSAGRSVCANDVMAIGALDAALGRGLKAPDDLAIVGVDDIEAASLLRPSLTTIRIPALEIGRTAGTLLMDRLAQGAAAPARHILVQHRLIVRDSA